MDIIQFIIFTFAVWRITHLLTQERGPFEIFKKIRDKSNGQLKKLITCFYCSSIWFSLPVLLYFGPVEWLSVSGSSCFLFKLSHHPD